MAWSVVNSAVNGAQVTATAGPISTVGADVLMAFVTTYGNTPLAGDLTDGGVNSAWDLIDTQAAAGDPNVVHAVYRKVSPSTSASHSAVFSRGGGQSYAGLVFLALSQGSATAFGTSTKSGTVAGGTDINAGSIGNANDVVVTGTGFFTSNGCAVGASFATPVEVGYVAGNNMGTAGSWKEVGGSVDPHWTYSGSNVGAAINASFTGGGVAATPGRFPYINRAQRPYPFRPGVSR